jgi:CBS domain-containing protein
MRVAGIDAVLVCDDGSVIGILTATDLVWSLATEVGPGSAVP